MSASEGAELHSEFACFEAGGRPFAVDVMRIREIVRDQEVTPLPGAPSLVEGVIDLRGRVLPVLDLGRVLGGESAPPSPRTRIAVLEVGALALGLRVEAAVDVISVQANRLEAAPALLPGGNSAIEAVLRRPGESPVLVIGAENLVEGLRGLEGPEVRES